jgi:HemY protein
MARVEQQEKNDDKEARRWFEMSITAKTDHSWTCKSCGATSEEWSALCGNCDAFDMLTWKVPPRVSAISKSITFDTAEEQLEIIEQ